MLQGRYEISLVMLSLLVAALASFTALAMASRAARSDGASAMWAWRLGGGCAMGLGIWSMHFIGMLAFALPIAVAYDRTLTSASLAIAIGSSVFALWLVTRPTLPHGRLAGGAVLMGTGIASMHYVGMLAMRMQPPIQWHFGWVVASLLVAVAASWSALFIVFRLHRSQARLSARLAASVMLGAGIGGMHYTGMAAARFPQDSVCGALAGGSLPSDILALLVVLVTGLILGGALLLAWMEQRLQTHLLRVRNASLSHSLDDAHAELTRAALHDPLTRLPNRRLLQQHIEQSLSEVATSGKRFAVVFIDLDGFKHVNDVYGHQTGDALLIAVSERLGRLLRPRDLLARLGGDEFVLVADLDAGQDMTLLAQHMLQALNVHDLVAGHELRVSASIGIALCPDHAMSERQLMACADAAMYQAKQRGRNRYVVYIEGMDSGAAAQAALQAELRAAIDGHQLLLHYQPKLRVEDGDVCGAEALVRWQHPQRGLIAPDQFIGLAERSGLIGALGRWALDEACRQLRQWHCLGQDDWTISVNLSPLQFTAPGLLQDVASALARHQLPARQLILEITESTVMRDTTTSTDLLQGLSALGVGISIDDFGTGYSSLFYLKRLPATELKIDHAFVRDLANSREDVVIVSSIIALGRALHMDVVAEGVETIAQRRCLEQLGCTSLQGYLLGRPVEAARFLQLHGERRPQVDPTP
ncbi:EAL domain-containing protein [Stenotrophomonas sp. CFBP 13725]|uniref:putative bifunctional diguanylate cyclase/phosphodiesterase n=1 Tax=Stenotrophomonas sp. CFBP 13725 TaxID=2775297 RepID=UPI00177C5D0A|nr:EAL domain-containing protein [Stenotrophomonas sp. CFBP 13725]MBD8634371.1 bifunctional diguanylate cyclase/phosphodiesterase [Stenotrophomonas sp. CFBP 13725]